MKLNIDSIAVSDDDKVLFHVIFDTGFRVFLVMDKDLNVLAKR